MSDDERRERYAAAMYSAAEAQGKRMYGRTAARVDAAIAVADVEQRELRAELEAEEAAHCNTENAAQREYARLRAELDALKK